MSGADVMGLEVQELCVELQKKRVIEQVSFTCEPGQLIALCGANGAGKSTLLRALAGELAYVRGAVRFHGRELSTLSAAEQAKLRAVMPQSVQLDFAFSGRDVIQLGLKFCSKQRDINKLVKVVSELLCVEHLLERNYLTCSGGEKQRLQLARTLAQLYQGKGPAGKYLLLDECSSAMDLAMAQLAFRALKHLAMSEVGIIAVVHDLNLASAHADHIILLHQRSIAAQGKPAEILTEQRVAEVFNAEVEILFAAEGNYPVIAPR